MGSLVQWLKLPALKLGDCGFETHFGFHVLKKQNVSSPLNSKDVGPPYPRGSVLALRPPVLKFNSNPVSGGQCHLIYLTNLRRLS